MKGPVSGLMKTIGLFICVFNYEERHILAVGIILLVLSWYVLNSHYQDEMKKYQQTENKKEK